MHEVIVDGDQGPIDDVRAWTTARERGNGHKRQPDGGEDEWLTWLAPAGVPTRRCREKPRRRDTTGSRA